MKVWLAKKDIALMLEALLCLYWKCNGDPAKVVVISALTDKLKKWQELG